MLSLAVLATLSLAAFAPACGAPTDEDEALDEGSGEEAYTTEGTCDGLPRLKTLKTPPGICVGLVTQGFTYSRGIAELPSGDFVLAEMGGWAQDRGAVWLLRRLPNKTFSKTRIAKLIDKPSGVTVGPDGLPYIGTPTGVFRFDPYEATVDPVPRTGPFRTTGDYKQPRFKVVIKDLPKGDPYRHPLKKMVFDKRDPWKLYVNIGSASDNCETGSGSSRRYALPCVEAEGNNALGTIRAYDLNNAEHVATGFTVVARGLRNSMALAVHPTSGALLQGENSRDSIEKADASYRDTEADFPHEELNVIVPGAHYGWPYCFDNNAVSPEYRGRVDCSRYTAPALLLPGHAAPLGMTYYDGSLLPSAYKGQLIVTYHGYRDNGHRLVMVPVDANGIPGGGEPLDIIRGWEKSADGREPLGAPVDVLAAKDGSLYITEDKNGNVLRLSFNAAEGNGLPMRAIPIVRPGADPAVEARCRELSRKNDAMSVMQKEVLDKNCTSCHGVGPGYPGNLRLDKCDAVGNWKRLTEARGARPALVQGGDMSSELVLRIQGEGYPQMPAGGIDPESFHALEEWIRAGAPKP
ncbi:MAG: PQQ-dependent sugar dehydrogenase [Labilithrix sp.]|nr:PQQ-dependent sugar dehydrogenase [Labilithrix sp.]